MGHTNETLNIKLPQFVADDKPTWMGDVNGAFQKIDGEFGTLGASVSQANSQSELAIGTANQSIQLAEAANRSATSAASQSGKALQLSADALTVSNNTSTLANMFNDILISEYTEYQALELSLGEDVSSYESPFITIPSGFYKVVLKLQSTTTWSQGYISLADNTVVYQRTNLTPNYTLTDISIMYLPGGSYKAVVYSPEMLHHAYTHISVFALKKH